VFTNLYPQGGLFGYQSAARNFSYMFCFGQSWFWQNFTIKLGLKAYACPSIRVSADVTVAHLTIGDKRMKWSRVCVAALLCLALAGQAYVQTSADNYRKAGAAYFKAGQFSNSVTAYKEVIRLRPNDADAYQHLGEAYERLNMPKEAAAAYEKQADILLSGNAAPALVAAPATRPTPAATPPPAATPRAQNPAPQAPPQPPAANGQTSYKVGQRVDYIYNGKWYKAIIVGVRDDRADHLDGKLYSPYRVHPLGYETTMDSWVCCADFSDHRSQLRAAGGPTEPVPGGEANDPVLRGMGAPTAAGPAQPPAKQYHCVFFVGDHLSDVAPFTLTGSNTYTDSEGKRGTFSYDMVTATLTFHGGNYDGQRAEYEMRGGKPQIHILGPSGRRVIDCD
jgi:hypothetical protein